MLSTLRNPKKIPTNISLYNLFIYLKLGENHVQASLIIYLACIFFLKICYFGVWIWLSDGGKYGRSYCTYPFC